MADEASPQTLTKNMNVKVPIDQLWEAFKNLHHLLPRLLPGFVDISNIVEGPFNGGVGSVRDCIFNSAGAGYTLFGNTSRENIQDRLSGKQRVEIHCKDVDVPGISRSKEKIEVVDNDGHVLAYSVIEGEVLNKFQSYRVQWSFASDVVNAGTSVNWTAKVVPLEKSDNNQNSHHSHQAAATSLSWDDIYSESAVLLVKQLEEHLLVTGEYKQPSFKESLREELLFS